jgi:hypothetical protein
MVRRMMRWKEEKSTVEEERKKEERKTGSRVFDGQE